MKWSEKAWQAALPIYNSILSHPFIGELINGTLERQKFIFYIKQDSYYLSEYGKVLAGISARLSCSNDREAFLHFAGNSVAVENALHGSFLANAPDVSGIPVSPGCLLYTGYLHQQLATKSIEEALASVLPCFWIYKKVGDFILENQSSSNNPYQHWIDTYGGEEFAIAVKRAVEICDRAAENASGNRQSAMTEAYVTASKMEWIFWDSAYRREQWPDIL